MTADVHGRKYATIKDTKKGDRLICDDGFTCLRKDGVHTVKSADDGLYIECRKGRHYLSGQVCDDTYYVGLYPYLK